MRMHENGRLQTARKFCKGWHINHPTDTKNVKRHVYDQITNLLRCKWTANTFGMLKITHCKFRSVLFVHILPPAGCTQALLLECVWHGKSLVVCHMCERVTPEYSTPSSPDDVQGSCVKTAQCPWKHIQWTKSVLEDFDVVMLEFFNRNRFIFLWNG